MEKQILDGRLVADSVKNSLKERVENLIKKGITPCFSLQF